MEYIESLEHISFISYSFNEYDKSDLFDLILNHMKEIYPRQRKCLAGGYAAYFLNRITYFNDIDIFVECNDDVRSEKEIISTSRYYLGLTIFQINLIFVSKTVGSYENFVFSILNGFDMDICKVGFYFNTFNRLKCIEFPRNFHELSNSANSIRHRKYLLRKTHISVFNPPDLLFLAYKKLFEKSKYTYLDSNKYK